MTESNNKGNNQALELMTQRNNFYTDKVKLLLSVVVLAMIANLVSISLIFGLSPTHRNRSLYWLSLMANLLSYSRYLGLLCLIQLY